jgi:hypothetical protein
MFLLGVFGIALWVLATNTIGRTIRDGNQDVVIGGAVAALAVVAAALLPSVRMPAPNAGRVSAWLVGTGAGCVLLALALQFYLAAQAAENARRAADIMEQSVRSGQRMTDVNVRARTPDSVEAVGYLCVLVGVGMIAYGIQVGMAGLAAAPADETREP